MKRSEHEQSKRHPDYKQADLKCVSLPAINCKLALSLCVLDLFQPSPRLKKGDRTRLVKLKRNQNKPSIFLVQKSTNENENDGTNLARLRQNILDQDSAAFILEKFAKRCGSFVCVNKPITHFDQQHMVNKESIQNNSRNFDLEPVVSKILSCFSKFFNFSK